MRRSTRNTQTCKAPVLTALFGPVDDVSLWLCMEHKLCFERDLKWSNAVQSDQGTALSSKKVNSISEATPTLKKRKLKDGKAMALGKMLDGL